MSLRSPAYTAWSTLQDSDADLLASYVNLKSLVPGVDEAIDEDSEVPRLPPACVQGFLSNGLTYFVMQNREPKSRAELFLVVGFGSLVEDDEERGIAHIIEHLGFSATKAYENHAIVKFLESIGAPFGACQNAYTSFDRTVYTLHVPTDKDGIVEESLKVLREFAYFTRISDEDLEKERKVVLEEWRESRNAQGRLSERYIQALCGPGCRYCERLPIGKLWSMQIRRQRLEVFRCQGRNTSSGQCHPKLFDNSIKSSTIQHVWL